MLCTVQIYYWHCTASTYNVPCTIRTVRVYRAYAPSCTALRVIVVSDSWSCFRSPTSCRRWLSLNPMAWKSWPTPSDDALITCSNKSYYYYIILRNRKQSTIIYLLYTCLLIRDVRENVCRRLRSRFLHFEKTQERNQFGVTESSFVTAHQCHESWLTTALII